MEKIQINFCDVADLMRVPGIGSTLAQRILSFREGLDITPELLHSIPGIKNVAEISKYFDFSPFTRERSQERSEDGATGAIEPEPRGAMAAPITPDPYPYERDPPPVHGSSQMATSKQNHDGDPRPNESATSKNDCNSKSYCSPQKIGAEGQQTMGDHAPSRDRLDILWNRDHHREPSPIRARYDGPSQHSERYNHEEVQGLAHSKPGDKYGNLPSRAGRGRYCDPPQHFVDHRGVPSPSRARGNYHQALPHHNVGDQHYHDYRIPTLGPLGGHRRVEIRSPPPEYLERQGRGGTSSGRDSSRSVAFASPPPVIRTSPISRQNQYSAVPSSSFRSEGSAYRPVPLPRTLSFDGTGSYKAFIAKFQLYAQESQWNLRQCKNNLCYTLEGEASKFVASILERDSNVPYRDLVKKLEKRFAMRELPEVSQMKFTYARQAPEEPVEQWADRLLSLAYQAFPELPEKHVQSQAVMRFCQGSSDKEAGQHALYSRPNTLEEAVDLFKWFQHTHRAIYGKPRKEIKQVSFQGQSYHRPTNHTVSVPPRTREWATRETCFGAGKENGSCDQPAGLVAGQGARVVISIQ
nr:uncharacterized protein LOC129284057 [Lytechinus pictus]